MSLRDDNETKGEIKKQNDCFSSGKFLSLFNFMASKDGRPSEIAKSIPENAKCTSPKIQNKIIHLMASIVRQKVVEEVQQSDGTCYNIKCDGTT